MTLNNKVAFEVWAGIVLLIVVIGGVAGVTLLFGKVDVTPLLTKTQVVNSLPVAPSVEPTPEVQPTPFVSTQDAENVSTSISNALLGGASGQ